MINLEIPKKFKPLANQANQVAAEVFRPISRKYDEAEHAYPKELDMLASLIDGMNEGSSDLAGAGAAGVRRSANGAGPTENRNGTNMSTVLGVIECCWGDVGLLLSMPRQGLGNSAAHAVPQERRQRHDRLDQQLHLARLRRHQAVRRPGLRCSAAAFADVPPPTAAKAAR